MKRLWMIFVFVTMLIFIALPAQAVPIIPLVTISDGITTKTLTDQDFVGGGSALIDGDPVPGKLFATTFGLGAFDISVALAATKPFQGSASLPLMTLHVIASSSGAGTLTVNFMDGDFSTPGPIPGWFMGVGGTAGSGATVDYSTFVDPANTGVPGAGSPIGSFLGLAGTFGVTGNFANPVALPGLYSLTQKLVITHTGATTTSADAILLTPEPGTVMLLGFGLLGLGVYGHRRKKNPIS